MPIRSMVVAVAAICVVSPLALRAQDDDIDFVKARKEFVAGQPKIAANTLLYSSLGVRQQVGRCRDEVVGAQLLEAETQLEKLATALRNGTVTSVKTLDQSLTHIDFVIAQHHLQLVMTAMEHPRADNIPIAGNDLDRAAFHFERSLTLAGGTVAPENATVIADARRIVKTVDDSKAFPAEMKAVVKQFDQRLAALATK
jgi:hypothetical protein